MFFRPCCSEVQTLELKHVLEHLLCCVTILNSQFCIFIFSQGAKETLQQEKMSSMVRYHSLLIYFFENKSVVLIQCFVFRWMI